MSAHASDYSVARMLFVKLKTTMPIVDVALDLPKAVMEIVCRVSYQLFEDL